MSWKMKCMDNQEKPCEYTLSEAEMFAFLGKKTDPADNLTGKVLLVRLPDKKVEGLMEIRKVFQPKASALPWLKGPYPAVPSVSRKTTISSPLARPACS